jgi:hypothetical protein
MKLRRDMALASGIALLVCIQCAQGAVLTNRLAPKVLTMTKKVGALMKHSGNLVDRESLEKVLDGKVLSTQSCEERWKDLCSKHEKAILRADEAGDKKQANHLRAEFSSIVDEYYNGYFRILSKAHEKIRYNRDHGELKGASEADKIVCPPCPCGKRKMDVDESPADCKIL